MGADMARVTRGSTLAGPGPKSRRSGGVDGMMVSYRTPPDVREAEHVPVEIHPIALQHPPLGGHAGTGRGRTRAGRVLRPHAAPERPQPGDFRAALPPERFVRRR